MKKQFVLFAILALMLAGAAFASPQVHTDQDVVYAPATGPPVVLAATEQISPAAQTGVASSIDIELANEATIAQPTDVSRVAEGSASDFISTTTVAVGIDPDERRGVTTGTRYFPEVDGAKSSVNDFRGTKRPDTTFVQLTS